MTKVEGSHLLSQLKHILVPLQPSHS